MADKIVSVGRINGKLVYPDDTPTSESLTFMIQFQDQIAVKTFIEQLDGTDVPSFRLEWFGNQKRWSDM